MKKIFLSKPFVFMVVLFSVIVLMIYPCFAFDSSLLPDGLYDSLWSDTQETFDNANYFVLLSNQDTINPDWDYFEYRIYYSDVPFNFMINQNNKDQFSLYSDYSENTINYINISYYYKGSDSGTFQNQKGGSSSRATLNFSEWSIINSNQQLIDSNTDEVFFNPPVQAQGMLAEIMSKITMTGVLQEIIMILPIVLLTLVGLIGLRKALAMLSTLLHRA